MNRSLRYVLLALLWSAVAGYLCFAGAVAVRGRAKRTVSRVEIEVVDSTSRGCLVSTMRAREWIGRSGIPTIGTAVDAVDLRGIERLIARNGFVKEAIASVDYSGTLRVSISQREPLLRLLTDGTNSYVTADGYVFAAPKASSLYVPVVTGDYPCRSPRTMWAVCTPTCRPNWPSRKRGLPPSKRRNTPFSGRKSNSNAA